MYIYNKLRRYRVTVSVKGEFIVRVYGAGIGFRHRDSTTYNLLLLIEQGNQLYHSKMHVNITFHGLSDTQQTFFHPENYTHLIHTYYSF